MWYYANNNEQLGPFDEADFAEAVASGVIRNDTLVWREGMADWQPLRIARPQSPPALPVDYTLQEGGGPDAVELVYASIGSRIVAKLIDGAIFMVLRLGILIIAAMSYSQGPAELPLGMFAMVGPFFLALIYDMYFVGKYGATLGKMLVGIQIINKDGSSLTTTQAAGRYFAEWLSELIIYIGYLLALFDEDRRTLHDLICDTRVVRWRGIPPATQ